MSMPELAERVITFSQAVNEALAEEMRREETVFTVSYTHLTLPTKRIV